MTCPPCNHACNEGRACQRRAAMQLHRIDPVEMARKQGFISAEGGVRVHGADSMRLPPRAAPTEAATEKSDAAGRLLLILAGVLAALLVAASAFDLRFPT